MLGNVDNKTTDVSRPEELIGLHKLVSNFEAQSRQMSKWKICGMETKGGSADILT